MIRFALLLLISVAVSSQAVAAVKWNNPTSKEENEERQKKRDNHWTNNVQEVLGYQSEYIKGINKQQEAIINEVGDPLDCIDKIKSTNECKMLLQVHDELIFEIKNDKLKKFRKIIVAEMENALKPKFDLSVPLSVDSNNADNWSDAH